MAVDKALRDPRILHEIFKHLDTQFLLSTCRLVNKTWSKEATKCIQNNRQCYVSQPANQNACNFLSSPDKFFGKMAKEQSAERIPFNGLKINLCSKADSDKWAVGADLELTDFLLPTENLEHHFNLNHLDIFCGKAVKDAEHWYCFDHNPLATLLCDKSKGLKSLKISGSVELLGKIWMEHWPPLLFHQLELLDISEASVRYKSEKEDEEDQLVVQQLFSNSPKLKKIIARNERQVALIPKEKMPLLVMLQEKLDLRRMKEEYRSGFVKASE